MDLNSLPLSLSPPPCPFLLPLPSALSQELSSSTESIDNSFSSVSGARLGLGGRLPPWPHFLSVPRSSKSPGQGWREKVPFLPGRSAPPSQASQAWRSPLPVASALSPGSVELSDPFPGTAGVQCDLAPSSWVSRSNSWERGRIYPWIDANNCLAETPRILFLPPRTLSPWLLPSDHQIFIQCFLNARSCAG